MKYIIAFTVSLAAMFLLMPSFIEFLKKLSFRQSVSEYALADDQKKAGTPIMGGILFILIPAVVTVIVSPSAIHDLSTMMVLLAYIGYGLIGFADDYLIAVKKNNDGLSPWQKFGMQVVLAVLFYLMYKEYIPLDLNIPFTGRSVGVGWVYFVIVLFMFAGSSNAVNLTDGMDGLAAGCMVIAMLPLTYFAWQQGQNDLLVFAVSLVAALLGYLYFNKKPARVFMGDTGALALGGVLAAFAMVENKELALIMIGGIFVIETVCVIIQQVAVRTVHKRVFSYTPIHYAFRLKGIDEVKIVRGFWLAEAVMALIGFWIGLH